MNDDLFTSELGLKKNGSGRAGHGGQPAAGTLFFDEIAELDSGCQRILLNLLPDSVAAQRPQVITARVISTTNRNLEDDIRSAHFRSELYYRINGVCLRLPPLRERKEDIAPLVESLITKHAAQLQRPRVSLSERTMGKLLDHPWPGNIRELENVVKEIMALGDEDLAMSMMSEAAAAPREMNPAAPRYSLKAAARAASRGAERELILKALAHTRWNRKRAAQELQISYKSLLYKLKQIGFPDSEAS
jgi:DNA-binding NtrC family response regulator